MKRAYKNIYIQEDGCNASLPTHRDNTKKLLPDERRLIPNIYLTVIEIKLISSPKFPPENSVMPSLITSSSS